MQCKCSHCGEMYASNYIHTCDPKSYPMDSNHQPPVYETGALPIELGQRGAVHQKAVLDGGYLHAFAPPSKPHESLPLVQGEQSVHER